MLPAGIQTVEMVKSVDSPITDISRVIDSFSEFGFQVFENAKEDPTRPYFEARIGNIGVTVGRSGIDRPNFRMLTSKRGIDAIYKLLKMKAPDAKPPSSEIDQDIHLVVSYTDDKGNNLPFAHVQLRYLDKPIDRVAIRQGMDALMRDTDPNIISFAVRRLLAEHGVIPPTRLYFEYVLPPELENVPREQQAELMTYFSLTDILPQLKNLDAVFPNFLLSEDQREMLSQLQAGIHGAVEANGGNDRRFLLDTIPLVRAAFLMGMLKLFERNPSTRVFIGNAKEDAGMSTLKDLNIPYITIPNSRMAVPVGQPEALYFHAHADKVKPFYIPTDVALPQSLDLLQRIRTQLELLQQQSGGVLTQGQISMTVKAILYSNKRRDLRQVPIGDTIIES